MTGDDLARELDRGAKFVIYNYCISLLVVTFRRSSSIYFVRQGESDFGNHWKHTGLSLVMGWWGIPWGPVYTIQSLYKNLRGGTDVTNEVLSALSSSEESEPQQIE